MSTPLLGFVKLFFQGESSSLQLLKASKMSSFNCDSKLILIACLVDVEQPLAKVFLSSYTFHQANKQPPDNCHTTFLLHISIKGNYLVWQWLSGFSSCIPVNDGWEQQSRQRIQEGFSYSKPKHDDKQNCLRTRRWRHNARHFAQLEYCEYAKIPKVE